LLLLLLLLCLLLLLQGKAGDPCHTQEPQAWECEASHQVYAVVEAPGGQVGKALEQAQHLQAGC
jgi:hypothetical protein